MRILEHRLQQKLIPKTITVHCKCGCLFEFENDDPAIVLYLSPWGDNECFKIRCPECGEYNHLNNEDFRFKNVREI